MKKRWFTPSFEASSKNDLPKHSKNYQKYQDKYTRISKSSSSVHQSTNILDRCEPKTLDDLVVHAKKIKELKAWLRDQITNRDSLGKKYLLLLGPNGCGKTSAFRVIAQSLGVHIIEWITPLDRDFGMNDSSCELGNVCRNSAHHLFDDFLWHASRYGGLLTSSVLKIILIKDFPHAFIQKPELFHNLVKKYCNCKTYPIAFICNDNLARILFPDVIREECHLHTIAFNPVSITATIKAFKRVLELERVSNPPSMADMRNIYEISKGDLRSALLQFHLNMSQPSPGSSNKVTQTCLMSPDHTINKDQLLDLFKLLGRVLFSKRINKTNNVNDYAFIYDPDEIVKTVTNHSFPFVAFLQENYVSRFSDINSIARAADEFSKFDEMTKQHNCDTESMALAFLVRSIMVINSKPKKSFSSFNKPKYYNQSMVFKSSRSLRHVFPSFQLPTAELVMYVLPSLKNYGQFPNSLNGSQLEYINTLLNYSNSV